MPDAFNQTDLLQTVAKKLTAEEFIQGIFGHLVEATNCTIVVGAEASDVRAITITVTEKDGTAVDAVCPVTLDVMLNAAGSDFAATGGSTGIAIGASGKLLTVVAKKSFRAVTTAAGVLALTWTDTGTEAAFLRVTLPNGRTVMSDALTNA